MQRATRGSFLGVLGRAFEQLYAAGNPTKYSEIAHFNQTVAQLQQAGPFPPVPLIVISAGKRSALASDEANRWISAHQRDLVTLSPRGTQVIAENSGHFVQNDQPDIVIQAIRQVLADSQQRTSTSGESGRTHAHGD
jgi:pimeloyl-ACP methyl ester carboxylesterase